MQINVFKITGAHAMTLDDGIGVYKVIEPALRAKQDVQLDFTKVVTFASPFFNAAVGQLLSFTSVNDLRSLLSVQNISPAGSQLLNQVIENSAKYYSSPDYRKALLDSLKKLSEEDSDSQ